MSGTRAALTERDARNNEHLADAVGEGLAGQLCAAKLIERIQGSCGAGDELQHAVRAVAERAPAFQASFFRRLQKSIERAASK